MGVLSSPSPPRSPMRPQKPKRDKQKRRFASSVRCSRMRLRPLLLPHPKTGEGEDLGPPSRLVFLRRARTGSQPPPRNEGAPGGRGCSRRSRRRIALQRPEEGGAARRPYEKGGGVYANHPRLSSPSGAPRSSRLSPAWPIGGAMPRWPYEAPANRKGKEARLTVPQEPSAM